MRITPKGARQGSPGDANLAKICQRIAGDETRHETFYTRMTQKVLDTDPDGGMLAFRAVIRGLIAMPGRLMYDGKDPDLFDHFAVVAQRTGVYTVRDYAAIIDHLVKTWNIAARSVSGQAAKAQEFLCRQAECYASYADEVTSHLKTRPAVRFSWIHGREVGVSGGASAMPPTPMDRIARSAGKPPPPRERRPPVRGHAPTRYCVLVQSWYTPKVNAIHCNPCPARFQELSIDSRLRMVFPASLFPRPRICSPSRP